ncbi:uncharacterized protein LOC105203691 [Solenopsis invicta]|uniref:uncharacterized protein LOC105203691 n=1 Tax=Solenopsis invicta TaxID=13686 RepID=UPI00193E900E|nr:uncharacterized protein LOC105203691 [Solenopsis invicta]
MIDEEEVTDRIAFEEMFYSLCARFRQLLNSDNTSGARRGSTQSAIRANNETISHVRLPKINLPTFSGRYDDWFPFRDTFVTIIHNNTSLSDIQRFQYLRAALTDKALDIVKPLEISENNYDFACLLKERYDNKRVIVQTHVLAIFELPVLTKENASDLRQLVDGASMHIRALTALNCNADKWDALLIHIITSKLDTITSREWHASLQGSELPTFKELINFLSHRSQILEESAKRNSVSSVRSDSRSQSRFNVGRQALHTTIERRKCNYCASEHLIYFCREFLKLSINQRIAEMRSRKMCLNCLRSQNHIATKCPSGSCRTCNLKHNTLLHISKSDGGIDDAGAPSASTDSASAASGRSAVATHSAVERGITESLLSTAVVYVYDANGVRRTCRALLDSGAQANFMTAKCVRLLGLRTRFENISFSGMGGLASVSNKMIDIKLQSRFSAFTAEIECVVTERITDKLPLSTIRRETFKLLPGVGLADPRFNVSSDIDLLIGVDLFWQLMCMGHIRATVGHPKLQKTRLGWIVAGRTCVGAAGDRAALVSRGNWQCRTT